METKIEVPNGHKAVVDHFIIDESSFIIIKVEPKEEEPEWKKFKRGDVLKKGDFVIVWDSKYEEARIEVYDHYNSRSDSYPHCTRVTSFTNAVKWDGTKEHFERVLKGLYNGTNLQ